MILVGMLDSPYVRRVAVSLKLLGLPFEHQSVSVFRHFDRFAAINPVVKAPTLVCDDGTVLMDSSLILDYVEGLVPPARRLMPAGGPARQQALHLLGFVLAACEKCVQIVYEHDRRPPEKVHAPWLERVTGQAHAGLGVLEEAVKMRADPWLFGEKPAAPDIALATTWTFAQAYLPREIEGRYPAIARLAERAEALPEFVATARE